MNFDEAVTKILEKLNTYSEEWIQKDDLKRVKIDKFNIEKILNYLLHHNLVIRKKENDSYMVNPMGIKYLLESQRQNEKKEFDLIVAFTGCIIALVGAHTFLKDFMSQKGIVWLNIVSMILVVLCLVPVVNFIYKRLMKGDNEDE